MITNDKQYKIAKSQITMFREALEELNFGYLDLTANNVHPKIQAAQKEAIHYKLEMLLNEIQEYEALKQGKIIITPVRDLSELPDTLIKSRIANGFTQAQLAELLGLKEQQIQRYEADRYEAASLKTLLRVADALKVKLSGDVQIKSAEGISAESLNKYPFRQMFERKWFKNFVGSYNDAIIYSHSLIDSLFEEAQLSERQLSFNRQLIRSGSTINEYALKAWYARVVVKAREQSLDTVFNRRSADPAWIHELVLISGHENGPAKAVDYLKSNGIHVVIEPHLEGTHLDGAALLMDEVYPIIALTLRHDRLDNFWFVLLHELAHILLHLGPEYTAIFDDLDVTLDGIESEADRFALDALIPDTIWKHSMVRFSPSEKTIINQARLLKIHPALVAGRIRRETGRYYEFAELIGQGEVRNNFFL